MSNDNDQGISRRKLLGQVTVPVIAASAGAVFLNAMPYAQAQTAAPVSSEGARVYDVRSFGARGDGKTVDTAAVQSAVDTCNKDKGGTVLIPAGDFVVGTIELKSNVTLHIAAQGRLLGSPEIGDYRAGNGVPPGNGNVALIYAVAAENCTIEGPGTIDGNGAKFYTGKGDNTGPGQKSSEGYFQRPHLMIFYRCKNLRVRDVFLTASAYHCMRVLDCRYAYFTGIRIHNRVNKNNDGFHLVGNQYLHIANCDVACQDDACALFGSNKFVTITNCTFSTRWSIFRFGGGEAENITISNCVIYDTFGCAVKIRCGARSRIENVSFSNLIMRNVTGPISIGLDSTSRRRPNESSSAAPGIVRNISFNGIRASVVAVGRQYEDLPFPNAFRPGETRTCIALNGVGDEFLQNISFNDVHVTYEGGGTAEEAAVREVPGFAGEYFELGVPPAYGMYARNVRGLTMQNVRLEVIAPDLRPAVVFDHVTDAAVNGLSAQGNPNAESLLRFIDSRDVLMTASRVLTPTKLLLQLEGTANQAITIDGGDLSKAATPVAFVRGANPGTVKVRA
jgi:hypothetical protein